MRSVLRACAALVIACSAGLSAPAQDVVSEAVFDFHNLQYDGAMTKLSQYLRDHPQDLRALNYRATTVLYRELFRRGLLETQLYAQKGEAFKPSKEPLSAEFDRELAASLDAAQQAAEQRLKASPGDREAAYWAGVTHGTRATYHFTLRRAWMAALHEAKDAQKYHRELLAADPNYADAQLIVGLNDYVVGSLPWMIRMMAALTGAHGNKEEGMREVQHAAGAGHYAADDARFMLVVLYQREKKDAEALKVLGDLVARYPLNFLLQQELAAMFKRLDNWTAAAEVYDRMVAGRRSSQAGYERIQWPRLLYFTGQAHEHNGDNEKALALYQEAGQLTTRDVYVNRAELALANLQAKANRTDEARKTYEHVAAVAGDSEEARQARKALKILK